MTNKFSRLFIIVVLIALAGGSAYALRHRIKEAVIPPPPPPDNTYHPDIPDVVKSSSALLNVPFTSQAPTFNWADPREEDACEEAAILMAWSWIKNESLNDAKATEKKITDISDYETAHTGNYFDTDAADTAKLMTDYYGYTNLVVKMNPTIEDIKDALRAGKLVLAPANGQKLGNPNYTGAGPLTHFLVIKGFDDATGLFTTNDSGTRLGNNYKYTYATLYNALVDYPTGHHEDQTGRPKAMIVVTK